MRFPILLGSTLMVDRAAQEPPLTVRAQKADVACLVEVEGRRFDLGSEGYEEFRALVESWPSRQAVIELDRDIPWRCLGGLLFTLQRAGFQTDVRVDGVSSREAWLSGQLG